jgi:hypothetical protein
MVSYVIFVFICLWLILGVVGIRSTYFADESSLLSPQFNQFIVSNVVQLGINFIFFQQLSLRVSATILESVQRQPSRIFHDEGIVSNFPNETQISALIQLAMMGQN